MTSGEFELIDAMLAELGDAADGMGVIVGPGDDAAVLQPAEGCELVVSTDTLVAGRHFPVAADAALIGYRSMAVATSDLAAMGARPAWATVALTREELTMDWARRYAKGVRAAAVDFKLAVVGGNVAQGPTSITVTAAGHVPFGRALRRTGAIPGDGIYVTGRIGGAGLALRHADLADCRIEQLAAESPLRRYWQPQPRIAAGSALHGIASAAIDISDGLSSELEHLCRASGVAANVALDDVPVFPGCAPLDAVAAGDDYELVFTAPTHAERRAHTAVQAAGVRCTMIGVLREGTGGVCWTHGGTLIDVPRGYRHF